MKRKVIELQVWMCKTDAPYGGGMIICAARSEEEAIDVSAKDEHIGYWFSFYDENGKPSDIARSEYFPRGKWRVVSELETTLTTPKVICADIYIE